MPMTAEAVAQLADDLASMADDIIATRDVKTLRNMAENIARIIRQHLDDRKLRDVASLFLSESSIDTLIAAHADWATPMGFGLDKLMDLDVLDMRNLRRVLRDATLVTLPHSQDARKAAAMGLHADARKIHRRQLAATWKRIRFDAPSAGVLPTAPLALTEPSTFGANVQRLRKKAGLSQKELADRLEVTQPQVSAWENDRFGTPTGDTLFRFAKAIGCTIEELLTGLDADYDRIVSGAIAIATGTEPRKRKRATAPRTRKGRR